MMYTKIKQLADEAIALQNKDRMDAALREISALCGETDEVLHYRDPEEVAAGLARIDAASHDAELVRMGVPMNTGFGLAYVRQEGCAIHPDDTDTDLTEEQYAKQLAAYERDQRDGPQITPAKKGGAK
jgi:hypothetical protein